MSEYSRKFYFNTALTARAEGSNDDNALIWDLVAPMHKRIKDQDGITRCYIDRFTIQVYYMSAVINGDKAFEIVQDAVAWASTQEGLFPLRGDKTPTASREVSAPQPHKYLQKVTVQFGTDLVAYPALPNGDFDKDKFEELTSVLVGQLADIDGVRHIQIHQGSAAVVFNTRLNDVHTVQERMEDVFLGAEAGDAAWFPYADNTAELTLEFSVGAVY